MRKHPFLVFCFFILFSTSLQAQQVGSLTGIVTERSTLKPVPSASVQLTSNLSTITDSAGRFSLTAVPTGSYTLTLTAVGYKQYTLYNLIITSGNEATLNIELETAAQELAGVTVQSSRRTARAAT